MTRKWRLTFVGIAALAFLVKAALAWNTLGTNDILMWQSSLERLRELGGLSLYQQPVPLVYGGKFYFGETFNHPPLVIFLLDLWGRIAGWSGIPLRTILRLTSSLADVGSLALVYQLMSRVEGLRVSPQALLAMAACPVSIFIAGFHGNTDPMMIFFVLLSLYLLEVHNNVVLCGLSLGVAMNIKIVPLVLVPALALYLRNWRQRATCLTFAGLALLLPAASALAVDAQALIRNILKYNSLPGHWGITFVTGSWWPYLAYGKYFMVAVVVATSCWMNYPRPKIRLFNQWGVIFFVFLLLTPGFGIQYLSWLVPWVVTLGPVVAVGHYALSGIFVFLVYTFWCGGLPWYFANSLEIGDWRGWLNIFQLLAWGSLWATLDAYQQSSRRALELNGAPRRETHSDPEERESRCGGEGKGVRHESSMGAGDDTV